MTPSFPSAVWHILTLQPIWAGCPNRCRHCSDEGGPPHGALMSVDDLRRLVDDFTAEWLRALDAAPRIRVEEDGFESTAHPSFPGILAFIRSLESDPCDTLSTNGFGLARAGNWPDLFASLHQLGYQSIGMAVHGPEDAHDRFVRRRGAWRDVIRAAERALDSGMRVLLEIHLTKSNIGQFGPTIDALKEATGGRATVTSGIDAYFMNDRLRALEAVRLRACEITGVGDEWTRAPDRGHDVEGSMTAAMRNTQGGADLCTYEPGGVGPDGRRLGRLRITPERDVVEVFDSRPRVRHGNLERDGTAAVWRSILETDLSAMPEPAELAATHGDPESDLLHPGPESVHMKLADRYWSSTGAAP